MECVVFRFVVYDQSFPLDVGDPRQKIDQNANVLIGFQFLGGTLMIALFVVGIEKQLKRRRRVNRRLLFGVEGSSLS